MSVSHQHTRTLFRSDLLHVLDYRCAGHQDTRDEISQEYEIVLPRAGTYQRKDAHGTFLADPNQVLFFNQGEPYDISHPLQGGDLSTIFIFSPALLVDIIRTHNPDIENNPSKIFQHSHITLGTRLQIVQYRILCAHKKDIEPLEIEEQIITSIGEIIDALYKERFGKQKRSRSNSLRAHAEQTHAVKLFLNTHTQSRLQLEQISAAVHLSPYHLCRVFKQNTGMPIHQYMKRLRLFNAAERMLENPNTRLDTLALDYGFANHGHFSTVFRQTFDVSPSDFRDARFRQMSKILKA